MHSNGHSKRARVQSVSVLHERDRSSFAAKSDSNCSQSSCSCPSLVASAVTESTVALSGGAVDPNRSKSAISTRPIIRTKTREAKITPANCTRTCRFKLESPAISRQESRTTVRESLKLAHFGSPVRAIGYPSFSRIAPASAAKKTDPRITAAIPSAVFKNLPNGLSCLRIRRAAQKTQNATMHAKSILPLLVAFTGKLSSGVCLLTALFSFRPRKTNRPITTRVITLRPRRNSHSISSTCTFFPPAISHGFESSAAKQQSNTSPGYFSKISLDLIK